MDEEERESENCTIQNQVELHSLIEVIRESVLAIKFKEDD